MMFIVYWRDAMRRRHYGFMKARTHDEAFWFAQSVLGVNCYVTAIYKAGGQQITASSICLNFTNPKKEVFA